VAEHPHYKQPYARYSITRKGMQVRDDKSGEIFDERDQVFQDGLRLNSRKRYRLDQKWGGLADK
jgi:hypothetical protein